jgi:PelA/Pel-15E family pectate lyase
MIGTERRERRLGLVAEVAIPVAYAIVTLVFSAHLVRFETGSDEGLNLVKAALVADGHRLYDEVWSDQPPLFTALLRGLFALAGESVEAARLLVLAFACALLWACARIGRIAWGPREAIVASLLLLIAPPFQGLSVAVMIGLPALAFGALAFACASGGTGPASLARVATSGVLLALGALTKLFVLPLVPIVLAGVARRAPRGARARPALVGAGAFAVTATIGFLVLASPAALEQLVAPHAAATVDASYRGDPVGPLRTVRHVWKLVALAMAGVVLCRPWRRPVARGVFAWALAAGAVISLHRPVWGHHLLLLTVPAALLGGAGAIAFSRVVAARWASRGLERAAVRRALALAVAVGVAWLLVEAGRWRLPRGRASAFRREQAVVDALRSFARPGDVLLTDRPMHAFRAGVPVWPETAVFSEKRLRTGHLTERRLIEIVAGERPALVLLGRFPLQSLKKTLRATYGAPIRLREMEIWRRDAGEDPAHLEAWPPPSDRPNAWYAEPEALRIAGNILAAQHADGGWGKNEDRRLGWVRAEDEPPCEAGGIEGCSTIDNDATTTEMRFLARVRDATGDARAAGGFVRGLDHLLRAQTASGGWPQVPAARPGSYHAAITLNDDAMARVMELLLEAAESPRHEVLDAARRERARSAFDRGVECLLRAQVRIGGTRTVWCAQHDPVTLAPVAARSYEPASLSGQESVGAVRLLMSVERPSPDVVAAVEDAVAWFARTRLPGADGAPPRWARFYDLHTSTPIWPDRDGTLKASPDLLSEERRLGYDYVTEVPGTLLEQDHPRWRARLGRSR